MQADFVDFSESIGEVNSAVGLAVQSFDDLNPDKLSPLLPQIVSRQATLNIGAIGHVAHGKTTVVQAISNVRTMRHSSEAEGNKTIHLGYANAKVFKCPRCPEPDCYSAYGSRQPDATTCPWCGVPAALIRHLSFIDCPGHDSLMATMLNGASVMDAAMLLVAANEEFPRPQTREHLTAVEIMRLKAVIVVQNKIDLVQEREAQAQCAAIKQYLKKTSASAIGNSPVIPINAQMRLNIDYVLEYLCHVPIPQRRFDMPLQMICVRSFDINKPGEGIEDLKGGVAGGSVQQGVVRLGQEIEVRPGLCVRERGGMVCRPLRARVRSLSSEQIPLLYAIPGGLIGVGTDLDPSLTRQNKLVGNVIGAPGTLGAPAIALDVEVTLLRHVVGHCVAGGSAASGRTLNRTASVPVLPCARSSTSPLSPPTTTAKIRQGELLQITLFSVSLAADVVKVVGGLARLLLRSPAYCERGWRVALCRRIDLRWRLIGWGAIRCFTPVRIG